MTEPCDLTAVEARRLIGRKALSPLELTDSCIARIEAVDGNVNAMVTRCFDRARSEAKAAEQVVARGDDLGLLHGLPMGVKDLNVTEGVLTTYGSPIHAENVPLEDERIIAALRKAGAIVIGKTNTPEFGAGANTKNAVFGATGNPFDPKRICGGSSGGSAVALATGMAPICTGSDTGGSLRTPASFCGVVSHRGTPGLVPSDKRGVGLTTYNVQGPMARNVADTSLMLAAMAGKGNDDLYITWQDVLSYDPEEDRFKLIKRIQDEIEYFPGREEGGESKPSLFPEGRFESSQESTDNPAPRVVKADIYFEPKQPDE